jgi:hypothetical protein
MDPHHDEFDAITARLEAGRPTLSAHELDDLARRCRLRSKRTRRRKEPFMRTRFAITSMLVIGVLLSCTAGAGMALSGNSSSGSAGTAQYAPPSIHHHQTHLVIPSKDIAPPPSTIQPTRQLATPADGSSLPFTGLLLIPMIILGVGLLLVGLVLRSRSSRAPNA